MGWNFELFSQNHQTDLVKESSLIGIDTNWRCHGIGCYSFLIDVFEIDPGPELLSKKVDLNELKKTFYESKNNGLICCKYKDFIDKFDKWINLGLKYDCTIEVY